MRSAIINLDFKLDNTGQLVLLEMADGINDSGYQGYDAHFTGSGEDKQMARAILRHFAQRYRRIHFIVNNASTTKYFQPAIDAYSVIVHEQLSDFLTWREGQDESDVTADVILVGDDDYNVDCRHAKEIKQLLQIKEVQSTVVGGDGMVRLSDSKVLFGLPSLMRPPTQWLFQASDVITALQTITSEYVVLKPDSQREGIGVVILSRGVLAEHGTSLMQFVIGSDAQKTQINAALDSVSEAQKNKLRELADCRKNNPLMPIILQAYISNQPVDKNGESYDPTGRIVIAITETEGQPTIELIDGYWKLPLRPINQGGLQNFSLSVVGHQEINSGVLFSSTQRSQIESELPKLLPWANTLLTTTVNTFFQQWDSNPPFPKLREYIVDYCIKHGDFEQISPELLQKLIADNRASAAWFIADRLHAELLHVCDDPDAGTCYPKLIQFLSEQPAESRLWSAIRAAENKPGVRYCPNIKAYLQDYPDDNPFSAELQQISSKLTPMQYFLQRGPLLFSVPSTALGTEAPAASVNLPTGGRW